LSAPAQVAATAADRITDTAAVPATAKAADYERRLRVLQRKHHGECMFHRTARLGGLRCSFRDDGTLHGQFTCTEEHQGFAGMVHGGVLAALADAAMAQCLLGHGVVAYTAELKLRFRKPVRIGRGTSIRTSIGHTQLETLFHMWAEIVQARQSCVSAEAKFYRVE